MIYLWTTLFLAIICWTQGLLHRKTRSVATAVDSEERQSASENPPALLKKPEIYNLTWEQISDNKWERQMIKIECLVHSSGSTITTIILNETSGRSKCSFQHASSQSNKKFVDFKAEFFIAMKELHQFKITCLSSNKIGNAYTERNACVSVHHILERCKKPGIVYLHKNPPKMGIPIGIYIPVVVAFFLLTLLAVWLLLCGHNFNHGAPNTNSQRTQRSVRYSSRGNEDEIVL